METNTKDRDISLKERENTGMFDTYGKRLKYFRISRGVTQQVLEAKSDVDRALISRYERGLDIPREAVKKRLADALGIDVSAFLNTPISNLSGKDKDKEEPELFNKKEFADRLKRLRKEKALSQVDLSRKAKIYHGQIAKYEREYSTPGLENSILLADALGVTIDFLLRGSNTNSSNGDILNSELTELLVRSVNRSVKEKETLKLVLNAMVTGFDKLKTSER